MRFLRLSLRDFRGVTACDIEFLPTGVTIVAGPNEIGKSSLAEAIDLLFDYPDNSRAAPVQAVQPVDRDEGSLVTLEFEAGGHRATYRKSFHRNRRTELTLHTPRPVTLVGREAHDRVLELLEGAVDRVLWRALRIQQGAALEGPELEKSGSLAAALDRAAGQLGGGERETTLFDAVRVEYEKFFTARGKESVRLTAPAEEVGRLEAEVERCEAELRRVRAEIETSERLDGEFSRLTRDEGALHAQAETARAALVEVEAEARQVRELAGRLELSRMQKVQAEEQASARESLRERVRVAEQEAGRLRTELGRLAPELERRLAAEGEASEQVKAARGYFEQLRGRMERAEADLRYREEEGRLQQLEERARRIRGAEAGRGAAEAELERNRATAESLERIRATHLDLERARAVLEAGSGTLEVEALGPFELGTPQGGVPLDAGTRWSTGANEAIELSIGALARIRVQPASSTLELRETLLRAQGAHRDALSEAGVPDLEHAFRAAQRRTEAEQSLQRTTREIRELRGDESLEQIELRAARIRETLESDRAERESAEPLPSDSDSARARRDEVKVDFEGAERALAATEAAHIPRKEGVLEVQKEIGELRARAEQQDALTEADQHALAAARENEEDERISERVHEASTAHSEALQVHRAAALRLEGSDPAGTRQRSENASAALADTRARLQEIREARIQIRSRLEFAGSQGFDEQLTEAHIQLERARAAHTAITRRAAAARLLFETLRTHREAAQRAYVEPLSHRVEQLGAVVFGSDFRVEIDPSLRVVSRTLAGRTVPFGSLSGGAREQISLLLRIACAMLVSPHGGVPLVFDDALGNSDAGRLDRIGALLALAGDSCQVIVLTCAPDRYRAVGGARRIELAITEPLPLPG